MISERVYTSGLPFFWFSFACWPSIVNIVKIFFCRTKSCVLIFIICFVTKILIHNCWLIYILCVFVSPEILFSLNWLFACICIEQTLYTSYYVWNFIRWWIRFIYFMDGTWFFLFCSLWFFFFISVFIYIEPFICKFTTKPILVFW